MITVEENGIGGFGSHGKHSCCPRHWWTSACCPLWHIVANLKEVPTLGSAPSPLHRERGCACPRYFLEQSVLQAW